MLLCWSLAFRFIGDWRVKAMRACPMGSAREEVEAGLADLNARRGLLAGDLNRRTRLK